MGHVIRADIAPRPQSLVHEKDPGVDLLERDRFLERKGMGGQNGHVKVFRAELPALEIGAVELMGEDDVLEPVVFEAGYQLAFVFLGYLDMGRREAFQYRALQNEARSRSAGADAHANRAVLIGANALDQFVFQGQDPLRVFDGRLSVLVETKAVLLASEERRLQKRFKLLYAARQSGLGHMKLRSCFRQRLILGDSH
nr:hypothetical protein [Xiamenia xianingshaonis]